ncbi:MAG: glycoside hydrolase family 2 [Spirochaetales bacterium]|nr:glycoside hydrolase family 2 [Spirochaetales bacterium]
MKIPLSEYPRPQMVRSSYMCLNGTWDLRFLSDGDKAQTVPVLVPYSPESEFSGVNRTLQAYETMLYSRHVDFPDVDFSRERLLVHFGAVDYRAIVFIDKEQVAEHIGGYLPFTVEAKKASFDLDVSVQDPCDSEEISRGKKSSEPGGIWYPKTSGIWQTVWAEKVPMTYIESLKILPDLEGFTLTVNLNDGSEREAVVSICGRQVPVRTGKPERIGIGNPRLWSPEDPYLYDFEVACGEDRVSSYVGLRTFSVGTDAEGVKRLFLNGKPYFHHGLLDQGYFKGGYYTPFDDSDFVNDITRMKEMGFNTLRKHIKVEPLRWYYHCDRLGMLVWQDMVSGGGKYDAKVVSAPLFVGSFLKDNRYDKFARKDEHARRVWEDEMRATIEDLFNCTCIAMWVPFNEAWGQFDSKRICGEIRKLDASRTIDHASGWHDQGIGDFLSLHVYFRPYRFKADKKGRAVILSEFGGFGMKTDLSDKKANSYRNYRSTETLTAAVVRLYDKQILPAKKKGLAASIYTQVSDVEHEVNGLLTYDRKMFKVDPKAMKEMSERLLSD